MLCGVADDKGNILLCVSHGEDGYTGQHIVVVGSTSSTNNWIKYAHVACNE